MLQTDIIDRIKIYFVLKKIVLFMR